jgi:hypothetical protein
MTSREIKMVSFASQHVMSICADSIAKVENRTPLKISRKSIFRQRYCREAPSANGRQFLLERFMLPQRFADPRSSRTTIYPV